jgi:hypothetical protein
VQQSDPFQSYYTNPYSLGYGPTNGRAIYGKPVYATYTTTSSTSTALSTQGTGGLISATSYPVRRTPAFITVLGPDFERKPRSAPALQTELQDLIDRSSLLRARGNIRVTVDGQVARLQGNVTDPRARRLAESLVRTTPGVREVQNQLVITRP